jgi:chromodomain-helicase-DNA-binding protein 4
MASIKHVSDSEEDSDAVELIQTPRKKEDTREASIPGSALSHRFREPPQAPTAELPRMRSSTSEEKGIAVMVQGPSRPWEYQPFVEENTVDTVLVEIDEPGGKVLYRIEYEDGRREDVSITVLYFALHI